jgi:CheY-like chemotaxis protein
MRNPIILSIEDSPFYQQMLSKILVGCDVEFAASGYEGILKSLKILPDFIFLDIILPDAKGYELIKKIRSYLPNVYIVMVTSENSLITVKESINQGANGYIVKPFSLAQIKKYFDIWKSDYAHLPRPQQTKEISDEIIRLHLKKDEDLKKNKSPYQNWMEQKLQKVYPFIFLQCLEVPIVDKGNSLTCYVLYAFGIQFNGDIIGLGMWTEVKNQQSPSKMVLKMILKDLKNRGINDIFIFINDYDVMLSEEDVKLFFPLTILVNEILPFSFFKEQPLLYDKIKTKIRSIMSNETLQSSEEPINMLINKIKEEHLDIFPILEKNLVKMDNLFIFSHHVRRIVDNYSWTTDLKKNFTDIITLREKIESIEVLQKIFLATIGMEAYNNKIIQSNQAELKIYTKEIYVQAIYDFFKLMPDRMPSDEYLVL